MRVLLIGTAHAGEASTASAGMLAPTVEAELGVAHEFAVASRDLFPAYLAALESRTGLHVPHNAAGILEVALVTGDADRMRRKIPAGCEWVDRDALAKEEPALSPASGAVFHPDDGSVDPRALMDALRAAVASDDRISIARENVCSIAGGENGCTTLTDDENEYHSDQLLLAAGAWTPLIAASGIEQGWIQPVRGQMVAYATRPLRHVVFGPAGYLVPRADGSTMAGSTMEHAGYASGTTDEGLRAVRGAAERLCPALSASPIVSSWAGLRPVTPDFLPIIGRDPARSRVIFACGHSRNGILLAPLTARVVAAIAMHYEPGYDLSQFRPGRF